VLALVVVYVAYFALLTSFEVGSRERLRGRPDPASGTVIVDDVAPGSAAASAGLRAGDRILGVGGRPVADILDWAVAVAHFPPDRPVEVEVEREGRAILARVGPPSRERSGGADGQMLLVFVSLRLPALAMALLLVWRRPRDPQAMVGAWLMATLATATDVPHEGMAAAWRGLPGPLAAALWLPYASGLAFGGAIILTFTAAFPRPLVRRAWVWTLLWLPALVYLAWLTPVLVRVAADGRTAAGDLRHLMRLAPVNLLYLLGGLAALVVGYRRLVDPNERRRVRVLVAGTTVGLVAPVPFAMLHAFESSAGRAAFAVARVASLLAALLPLSFAYAVLRHRLFDLRLVVRAGVRYALARRTLLALVPLLAGVLVLDLLRHGDEPLLAAVSRRGWIYAGVAGLALLARTRQRQWLSALDRRFFRERYDALGLLRGVIGEIEREASPTEAGLRAVAAIEAALHPELVALLLEEPGTGHVRAVAAAPTGREVPAWPADSRLLEVLQALGAPLLVAPARAAGVTDGLPAEDVERLEQTGVDLVVPVPVTGRKAALMLGPKRSGEPWDREERDLLATVAFALGALARRQDSAATPTASPLPALGGRYQLTRQLGSGGMGVVYDAVDRELERRVAVKLLREDRITRADGEGRFRREARALAAFSHPNVVTIHDFGVAADGRAFLVMEFLVGPTLRQLLREEGALPPARALEVLDGIVAAVDAAHRRRIVHRDLKPENIILARGDAGDMPKVLDFGLARLLPMGEASEHETATRAVVGTPRYMAPEQLTGGDADPSWDLWGLAVITFEMLTGEHPFEGTGDRDWRVSLLAGRRRAARLPSAEMSPSLDAFFSRALAVEKESRPQSPGELIRGLREALAGPRAPD
jgi:tRNA A-37 threonylcarbamoyl transferase component Bud32